MGSSCHRVGSNGKVMHESYANRSCSSCTTFKCYPETPWYIESLIGTVFLGQLTCCLPIKVRLTCEKMYVWVRLGRFCELLDGSSTTNDNVEVIYAY